MRLYYYCEYLQKDGDFVFDYINKDQDETKRLHLPSDRSVVPCPSRTMTLLEIKLLRDFLNTYIELNDKEQ